MAQNYPKSKNNNQPKPTIPSHSRSISTIHNNHQQIISFMPKFILKTLHRRKRSITTKYHKDHGVENVEKIGKIKRIGKHLPSTSNNQLMQFSPVARGASAMMSFIFRNGKQHDQEQRKDHIHKLRNLVKQVYGKTRSNNQGSCSVASTSKNCMFGGGDVKSLASNGGKTSSVKHVVETQEIAEPKRGLRIRKIMKIKSRLGDQKAEKRFELCKKKILMGEKCRPLHGSRLHYDENGVLVPDILPDT